MADAPEYYHPIIQAMIASAQNQRQKANLAEQTRAAKEQEAFRQQQLAQAEAQFEKDLELKQRQFEVQKQLLNAQAEGQHIENLGNLFGLTPKLGTQIGQQQPAIVNAGGGQFSIRPPTLVDVQNVLRTGAAAKAQGEAEGAQPAKLEYLGKEQEGQQNLEKLRQQGQQTLEAQKNEFEDRLTNKKLDFEGYKARLDNDTRLKVEQAAYYAHIRGIEIQQDRFKLDPVSLQNAILAEATGQTKRELNPNSPIDRAIGDGMAQIGWRPLDQKSKDNLLAIQQIRPVLQEMEDFANNYLPSTTVGAIKQGLISKVPIDTKAKAARDALQTNLTRVARGLEDQTGGRMLASQLMSDIKGFPDLGQNRENALLRVAELKRQYTSKLAGALEGLPADQQKVILQRYTLNTPQAGGPKTYKHNAVNPANGHTIGSDNGTDWFDAKTGEAIPKQ